MITFRSRWWNVFAFLLVLFSLWEIAARNGAISTLFFPAPSTIAETLRSLTISGTLPTHLFTTLKRVFFALAFGGTAGVLLGLAMGWSSRLRAIIDPFIAATHNIPKIAVFPLVMLIFGIGEFSKILLLSVASFFPMLINTMSGVRQISPIHFEVAKNYRASLWKMLTRVVLPGSLPMMLAGLRIAFNVGLMITLAIELVASKHGLGVMIWFAWETLRTEELYATLFVTASLGISFNFLLQAVSKRLVHWQMEREL